MSAGTVTLLIALIIAAAAVAWYFLVRRPALQQRAEAAPAPDTAPSQAPRVTASGTVPGRAPFVERYEPAPRYIDNRPVYVGTYSPNNDLANLIIAEEIVQEIREERREERFEDIRQERYEEPARYEAPDNGFSDNSGDFGSGDDGSF